MKKPIRVVMDADGVFVDFVGGVLRTALDGWGVKIRIESLPDWQIFDRIKEISPGLARDVRAAIKKPGFCAKLPPCPGAEAALANLIERERAGEIELIVATSPWDSSPYWMFERTAWFAARGLAQAHVIHTAKKGLLRADLFVDDKPSHIDEWREENPRGTARLWETPHNLGSKVETRLRSWAELFDLIDRYIDRCDP